ncbi:M18 family aminopeptidase [Pendulispora albinea]|uniref:M18 family aminopeptidase n=1 Tax=Pendulispora albinea TaxID=2741071 RepID=A0ABZ2M1S4_9BACT
MDVLKDLLAFLRQSPTPYHAVESAVTRLEAAGFRPLLETDSWSDLAPGKYFVSHGESALLAFIIPSSRNVRGFRIVGAHTDSPNLRLKPKPEYKKEGYAQLGVEVYGGALLNSWLDRDLSLAGRVLVRGEKDAIVSRLVRFDRALCRVPQLAIHLDRDVSDKGLVLNKQEHLAPILGLADGSADVVGLCARELHVDRAHIVSTDLMLYDIVAPTVGGADGEFLFSARLDNQAMCHAAILALIDAAARADSSDVVPLAALFDHEEVGSQSATGAGSAFLPRVLERIVLGSGKSQDDVHRAFAGSMCVSADMAHAVHPNYVERHEPRHRPVLNGGPVIKVNSQQRYATSAKTAALFADLCRASDVPVQSYAHRTDLPCGSTIGPITATKLGIATVDVGNPMLSMHSIRELGGTKDPERMTRVLARFYGVAEI